MNYTATQAAQRFSFAALLLDQKKRHQIWILLGTILAIGLAVALTTHGWRYYILDQAQRPLSPLHADLKPSGRIGLRLGMFGLGLFVLVYLYPLRKRWPWLQRIGNTKHWLDTHILLGLVAPVFITFHCAFKIHGFAGMAYWAMVGLTISGVVGRYFYAQIPRKIGAAEMSLKEMQEMSAQMAEQLGTQKALPAAEVQRLFRLPSSQEVREMPVLKALLIMTLLDVARPFKVWSLRWRGSGVARRLLSIGGILPTGNAELESVISMASRQATLAKKILFLSRTHRLFHLWHVVHRPFSLSFAIFVIIHVAVVTSLGYF